MRRLLFAPALAALASLSSPALAESFAPTVVRLFDAPGHVHPLADGAGRIPLAVTLPPGADAAKLGVIEVAPGVGAVRLAPGDVAAFAAAHPDLALDVSPKLHPLLDVSGAWTHVDEFRNLTGLRGKGVLVGVVDTGIDIRHPDFRDANGKTRIAWLLTAGTPKGLHPDLEQKFGCTDPKGSACAVYAADDIQKLIDDNSDEVTDVEGHGTHVASIAAGNGGPSVTAKPRYVGIAPETTLIIAAPPGSGGFVDTDILNAARFVFDRADAMGMPIALNLSLGGDYGSHDGTSHLETGLSAFVGDDKPGHAIVVAAGNSGVICQPGQPCGTVQPLPGEGPLGIHTEAHVESGEVVRVPIIASQAMDAQGFVWITFRPGDDVEVALEGPGGDRWIGFVGKGGQGGYGKGSGMDKIQAGVVNNLPSANSAISAKTNSAVVIFTGHWADQSEFAVLLRGSGDASLWVTGEKDAAQGLYFEKAVRQGTINVPATAPSLLAVGCTLNRVTWKPLGGTHEVELGALGDDPDPIADSACFFSAEGPTPFGVLKPEISAPGGFVAAAMSADADPRQHPGGLFDMGGCPQSSPFCAVVDDRHALAAGTSMSAPHVTGAAALLMELDPTLTQARLTEVLQAGARYPIGHIPDPDQLGPGSLDLVGAHQALVDTMATPVAPDLSRSWYTLGSAYARPDATWPIWGTIELRRNDGSIAAGVDGKKLSLTLRGGTVYQPITRAWPGLFTFAVAGTAADLGGSITIDVAYDGVSLGSRTLPVGEDVWLANNAGLAAASGACSCEAARGDGSRLPWLLAAAALFAARRRATASAARRRGARRP